MIGAVTPWLSSISNKNNIIFMSFTKNWGTVPPSYSSCGGVGALWDLLGPLTSNRCWWTNNLNYPYSKSSTNTKKTKFHHAFNFAASDILIDEFNFHDSTQLVSRKDIYRIYILDRMKSIRNCDVKYFIHFQFLLSGRYWCHCKWLYHFRKIGMVV